MHDAGRVIEIIAQPKGKIVVRMTGNTHANSAFGDLESRAIAENGSNPADRISLRDYVAEVDIGAFQSERGSKQRVRFNIVIEVKSGAVANSDDVDQILSYDTLTEAITAELAAERLNLLETLAERIAGRLLAQPKAARVFVRVEKLDRGPGALGVEIVRSGDPVSSEHVTDRDPVIAVLRRSALNSPHIGAWIDQLRSLPRPVILIVEPDLDKVPATNSAVAQKRIDLMAVAQAAWVLAGKVPACEVIETRTELEHALQDQAVFAWAPSKMVLDAAGVAEPGARDVFGLAAWLRDQLGGETHVQIGGKKHADLPWHDTAVTELDLQALGLA